MACTGFSEASTAYLNFWLEDPFYIDVAKDEQELLWHFNPSEQCVSYARSIHTFWSLAATGWSTYNDVHFLELLGGPNSDEYARGHSESYHSNRAFCDPTEWTYASFRDNTIVAYYDGWAHFNWHIEWDGDCWALLTGFYEYWVE